MNNQCNFCGGAVKPGDQFCKGCGAAIPPSPNQSIQPVNQTTVTTNANGTQQAAGKTPGAAIAALVCSLVGLIILPIPMGLIGVSMGATALNHYKGFPQDKGKGMAIAGIIIGVINIIYGIIAIVLITKK